MDLTAGVVVAATVFLWGTVAGRLERADLTAPLVFMGVGVALGGLHVVDTHGVPEGLRPLVEVTLVWVLFSDAARVRARDLRPEVGLYVRLLGIGLPLTVLAGWGLASGLLPGLDAWTALLLAAALAPTDAALGVPVVTNPVVPRRVRRLLTVESGLNDGLATPVVLLAIAGAESAEGVAGAPSPLTAVAELVVGVATGLALGLGGGWLLRWARRRGWVAEEFAGVAVLALALLAYATALLVQGNGFVAAFVGGLAFGSVAGRRGPAELAFLEQASGLVSLLVWLAFGAVATPFVLDNVSPVALLYAVLSLTVVRMVPVALATLGAGLDRRTVLFVGWFGPRGLASLLFALLALEDLHGAAAEAVAVVAVTVFLSVLAHGLSAAPLAARLGRAAAPSPVASSTEPPDDVPVRGLPRRLSFRGSSPSGRRTPPR
ncbi:MAG: cation:proton antiporter domain-containing protein [Oryzihumus sp.]